MPTPINSQSPSVRFCSFFFWCVCFLKKKHNSLRSTQCASCALTNSGAPKQIAPHSPYCVSFTLQTTLLHKIFFFLCLFAVSDLRFRPPVIIRRSSFLLFSKQASHKKISRFPFFFPYAGVLPLGRGSTLVLQHVIGTQCKKEHENQWKQEKNTRGKIVYN